MEVNKQWKRVPFTIELAKKIQSGEVEGKIKTKSGHNVRIVCFDKLGDKFPIVALIDFSCKENLLEHPYLFTSTGICDYICKDLYNLVLEVSNNEPQFKPFDKVLVRVTDESVWIPRLFSVSYNNAYIMQDGKRYDFCIPYEGNEHLVGTTKESCLI